MYVNDQGIQYGTRPSTDDSVALITIANLPTFLHTENFKGLVILDRYRNILCVSKTLDAKYIISQRTSVGGLRVLKGGAITKAFSGLSICLEKTHIAITNKNKSPEWDTTFVDAAVPTTTGPVNPLIMFIVIDAQSSRITFTWVSGRVYPPRVGQSSKDIMEYLTELGYEYDIRSVKRCNGSTAIHFAGTQETHLRADINGSFYREPFARKPKPLSKPIDNALIQSVVSASTNFLTLKYNSEDESEHYAHQSSSIVVTVAAENQSITDYGFDKWKFLPFADKVDTNPFEGVIKFGERVVAAAKTTVDAVVSTATYIKYALIAAMVIVPSIAVVGIANSLGGRTHAHVRARPRSRSRYRRSRARLRSPHSSRSRSRSSRSSRSRSNPVYRRST